MRIAHGNVDDPELVARNGILEDSVLVDLAETDQSLAGKDEEFFHLGVVPVIAAGDPGLCPGYENLTEGGGFDELGQPAARVALHLQRVAEIVDREVGEPGRVERFRELIREGGHHEILPARDEGIQHSGKLGERRHIAAADPAETVLIRNERSIEGGDEGLADIVDIDEGECGLGIVDLDGKPVGGIVTPGRDHRVVVGPAPFAEHIGEPEDEDARGRGDRVLSD